MQLLNNVLLHFPQCVSMLTCRLSVPKFKRMFAQVNTIAFKGTNDNNLSYQPDEARAFRTEHFAEQFS